MSAEYRVLGKDEDIQVGDCYLLDGNIVPLEKDVYWIGRKASEVRFEVFREWNPEDVEPQYPHWIDEIGIDPTGEIYAFEGGCYWDGQMWYPVDDGDGLRVCCIGKIDEPISVEVSKTMRFVRIKE